MAGTRVRVPKEVISFDDKKGNAFQLITFRIEGSGTEKIPVGESPTAATLVDGPAGWSSSNFYVDAPYTTSGDRADDSKRVGVKNYLNGPAGEYKILVRFSGSNAAGV